MTCAAIPHLDRGGYRAHELHRTAQVWPESNCYVDLWIEILNALELEPRAILALVLEVDFEGDQWTFLKPSSEDLRLLYGVELIELQIWDRFADHVVRQLERGRLVLVEVDAYFLPDTAGVSHGQEHVKTTIAIERVDLDARRMSYFHNSGYFEVSGDDFEHLLAPEQLLPPYAESIKLDRLERLSPSELRRRSWELLSRQISRRAPQNPLESYVAAFADHAEWLSRGDLGFYHRYAFASLRQLGAACELAAAYLGWLAPNDAALAGAAEHFQAIAFGAKAVLFRLARAVQHGKPPSVAPLIEVVPRWDAALERLRPRFLEPQTEVA